MRKQKQGFVHPSIMDKLEFKGAESFPMMETFFFNIYIYIVLPRTKWLLQNMLVYKTTLLWMYLLLTNITSCLLFFSSSSYRPWPYTTLERGYDLVTGEQAPEKILRWVENPVGHDAGEWSGILVGKCGYTSLADRTCALLGCNECRGTLMGTDVPSQPQLLWRSISYLSGI